MRKLAFPPFQPHDGRLFLAIAQTYKGGSNAQQQLKATRYKKKTQGVGLRKKLTKRANNVGVAAQVLAILWEVKELDWNEPLPTSLSEKRKLSEERVKLERSGKRAVVLDQVKAAKARFMSACHEADE